MHGSGPERRTIFGIRARLATLAILLAGVSPALDLPSGAIAATPQPRQAATLQPPAALHLSVVDENGAAVPSARITLTPGQGAPVRGETDYAGRKEFTRLEPGTYSLRVEKEGFFAVTRMTVHVGETTAVEVRLNHVREFTEQVNVIYSPPAIDPVKTQSSETLTSEDIIDLPYPVSRDIRYALPMLPGVLQDSTGQLHIDGASTRQVYDQIDGFNVADPATDLFLTRVSVDALRSADVAQSRYSTEFGKSSGGVISLRTSNGDNHWRITGTDPFPGLEDRRGLHVNNWTPRGIASGPIRPGKAWFMDAAELEYDQTIYTELPANADRYAVLRGSNLSKGQVNLADNNNLTVSLLINSLYSPHSGLDPLDPISTTQRYSTNAVLLNFKDQHLFQNGWLLEAGFQTSSFYTRLVPLGSQTYVINPNGTSGNYYLTNHGEGGRNEIIGNVFVPPLHKRGKHEVKIGIDIDRVSDYEQYTRNPYVVESANGVLTRSVSFTNAPPFTRFDVEEGGYAQDRWTISPRWLVEPGVRFDSDSIVQRAEASPRIASAFLLKRDGSSKISAGIGVYRDASNLDILTRSLSGTRTDSFYDPTGTFLILPPVLSTFTVDPNQLRFSIVNNASAALEQKLPRTTYLKIELMDRRARDIWSFVNPGASYSPTGPFSGNFILTNGRQDRYESASATFRHVFKQNHEIFVAYTRARALTNADFTYSLDSVLFSPQAGGPLPWDAPNRVVAHAFLPLTHKIDAAYTLDWRTGYPFTLFNDAEQIVGGPYSERFPTYFSLDVSLERRFTIFGFQWALRAGVDNITDRGDYSTVNSNVDSPEFLTYSGALGRSFIARVRLLGRK